MVEHLSKTAKAESSVRVTETDAKKVSEILIDKSHSTAKENLNFLKSVTKSLKQNKGEKMENINIKELKEYIHFLSGINPDESEEYNGGWNDALEEINIFLENIEKTKLKEKR